MPDQNAVNGDAVFFGCWGEPGHMLWSPGMREAPDDERFGSNRAGPFTRIDGQLTPKSTTAQGTALLHNLDGWTALAVHDYTGDSRPGSNSVFIFDADLDLDEALIATHVRFPQVADRIGSIKVVAS